ncbi:bifunctional glutamate N-acetyltransferase/amino-acid acetyltransferase ArgJ [Acidihalobacter ferrooxydans]|uniref:Arginine biosynthesis bifunctional protein ArgJ n=1 Tax=Acidihalobacter ferrooxydans TaxID=1765967 RepID=A0A1P8UEC7_9GAMM|nr:bifunctional glutamate N-acetyltransferase/amino-acid acetyltransferase ArgJ [Acidihalobacter ferrooxydans]APZ42149.1 bifunctional ornithine acetyltransferase/N-acetylglutamate synthase [Acidihalobacter ferrooxydans]
MAVGLKPPTELLPIKGIRLATAEAGIRHHGRPDVTLIEMVHGTRAAAVFTRNAFCAAPVIVAREHLAASAPRFLLINAGNANAGMGENGLRDARASCRLLSERAACIPEAVLPFSTGVIGEPLPVQRFGPAIDRLLIDLRGDGWLDAARAIMTTDTVAKGVSRQCTIDNRTVSITGIAKGSGMIHPDMATMLAFIGTDVDMAAGLLQRALQQAIKASFNSITVDGDTSTNDACVLLATGSSEVHVDDVESAAYRAFYQALSEVCQQLAQAIIRDGEGATKFVTLDVVEGRDEAEVRQIAFAVAHSPLVKTALFASDPNWGRILAAVGRAGVDDLDVGCVWLEINGVRIVSAGGRDAEYTEAQGAAAMTEAEIAIRIGLGRGSAETRIWTTDLSHEYVRINAEYRS